MPEKYEHKNDDPEGRARDALRVLLAMMGDSERSVSEILDSIQEETDRIIAADDDEGTTRP